MAGRPIQVLLIDDDEDEFIVARDYLSEASEDAFEVEWVGDFDQALARMDERMHDVYLVDYRLGAKSGLELMREASKRGLLAPMILLTGYDDKDTDREAIKAGAADYLRKSDLSSYLLDRAIRYAIYRTQMRMQAVSQERMASIGLLASSLAHEIGTPLGVIRGRAEYLAMQVANDPAVKKNVDVILAQIDRVSHLIRSLLNVARGEDKAGQLEVTSVTRAVNDIVELMDHEFRKSGIKLVNELDLNREIRVLAEPHKLHQVLLNITVNAVHAIQKAKSEQGRLEGHEIRISVLDLVAQWSICLEDTGCGISEDGKANLFRPFYTTKGDGVGTGLGLATSLWIVQSWGGLIEVESQQGIGTKVFVQIPKVT
jgi:signal transduction histidine kinase